MYIVVVCICVRLESKGISYTFYHSLLKLAYSLSSIKRTFCCQKSKKEPGIFMLIFYLKSFKCRKFQLRRKNTYDNRIQFYCFSSKKNLFVPCFIGLNLIKLSRYVSIMVEYKRLKFHLTLYF